MEKRQGITLIEMANGSEVKETNEIVTVENNIIDSEYGKILMTYDYDKFKLIRGNRTINQRTYKKLLVSMAVEQLITPITVNENMEIIDGQHRFHAEKELGLPVYYIIVPGYDIKQVKKSNLVSSTWKLDDYLNLHLTNENDHYQRFNQLVADSNLTLNDIIKVFSVVNGRSLNKEREIFNAGEYDGAGYEEVCKFVDAIQDFSYFKAYNSRNFVAAFITLYFFPTYDHAIMRKRLEMRKNQLNVCDLKTKDGYLRELSTNMYSFGSNKNIIYFDRDRKKLYTR